MCKWICDSFEIGMFLALLLQYCNLHVCIEFSKHLSKENIMKCKTRLLLICGLISLGFLTGCQEAQKDQKICDSNCRNCEICGDCYRYVGDYPFECATNF